MTGRVSAGGLQVARELHDFIETEALPGTGIGAAAFWDGFARIAAEFAPRNVVWFYYEGNDLFNLASERGSRDTRSHSARRHPYDP